MLFFQEENNLFISKQPQQQQKKEGINSEGKKNEKWVEKLIESTFLHDVKDCDVCDAVVDWEGERDTSKGGHLKGFFWGKRLVFSLILAKFSGKLHRKKMWGRR